MGAGILLYIRDDFATKSLEHDFGTNIKFFSVQVNLQKVKWFFNDSHNLHKNKLLND